MAAHTNADTNIHGYMHIQCFDTACWAAGRASGVYKIEWWGAGMVICLE